MIIPMPATTAALSSPAADPIPLTITIPMSPGNKLVTGDDLLIALLQLHHAGHGSLPLMVEGHDERVCPVRRLVQVKPSNRGHIHLIAD